MVLKSVVRGYREQLKGFNVSYKESDIYVYAEKFLKKKAFLALLKYRNIIEEHIKVKPEFYSSLTPIKKIPNDLDKILFNMYEASNLAGVGPFAAVAGAIAEEVATELNKHSKEVIVENGGDIFLFGTKEKIIKIMSINMQNIGLKINPSDMPISVCASSSKIGHSLSFGKADLVVVLSKKGAFADAFATSICNNIKDENDIEAVIKKYKHIKEIAGCLIFFKDKIGGWGKLDIIKIGI